MEDCTELIGVRVSKKQRKILEELAKTKGLHLGVYARMILVEHMNAMNDSTIQ